MFKRIYLPLFFLIIPSILFISSYWKEKIRKETVVANNIINVFILEVNCNLTTTKSFIVFNHNGGNHIVNLLSTNCNHFHIGRVPPGS